LDLFSENTMTIVEEEKSERLARPLIDFLNEIGVTPTQHDNLRKRGLAPECIEIPGTNIKLTTPSLEKEFIERLLEYTRTHPEELQEQRQRRALRGVKRWEAAR
jgi:hypothetical protein